MDDGGGGFSGVVRLSNVNDFIVPEQSCIIPLNQNTRRVEEPLVGIKKKKENSDAAPGKAVKVTLSDCLACTGCVTSAETVLVEQQSVDALLEAVSKATVSVVTVSPQSVCSIAARRGISVPEAARLIATYFFSKGVRFVLDSSFGRHFSLERECDELEQHLEQPQTSRATPPLLSSICPGFVLYSEKTHGSLLVPLLSRVRSPQAVMGALVKRLLSSELHVEANQICHATVMPCFDKKLEASRSDFLLDDGNTKEVDCVVSTGELDSRLEEVGELIESTEPGWLGDFGRGVLIDGSGGTSGGYAEAVAQRLLQRHPEWSVERQQTPSNPNLDVITLTDGIRTVKIARVYGFRNIQNLVRKLKTKKCDYDYVEVMACPGGCGNGGGQIRYEMVKERDEALGKVEQLYASIEPNAKSRAEASEVAHRWKNGEVDWERHLKTAFRTLEPKTASTLQW